ncbi:Nif11 family protein [Geofilum sp. OHC36d9]|uniref:Nif11 family protein n=1 Tax=Geofilum sp. OHC36d9 TaxID=3458413 RepID=UPI0040337776
MSIANATTFIRQFENDTELRKLCNSCRSQKELLKILDDKQLGFSEDEFNDVLNSLLVKCQSYEQAGYIEEIKRWFMMFK